MFYMAIQGCDIFASPFSAVGVYVKAACMYVPTFWIGINAFAIATRIVAYFHTEI